MFVPVMVIFGICCAVIGGGYCVINNVLSEQTN